MAEVVLITRNDIEQFWPVGKNIDNARLLQHIKRAQQAELKPFLGSEFYFDFVTNFQTTTNQALFTGGQYAYQGNLVFFGGVRQLLVSWAYARLYIQNPDFVTRGGNVRKDTDESEPQEQSITNARAMEAKSDAIRLQQETFDFLDQNKSTYPLWLRGSQGTAGVTRTALRINKVRPISTVQKRGF